jgi:hypothetical protein
MKKSTLPPVLSRTVCVRGVAITLITKSARAACAGSRDSERTPSMGKHFLAIGVIGRFHSVLDRSAILFLLYALVLGKKARLLYTTRNPKKEDQHWRSFFSARQAGGQVDSRPRFQVFVRRWACSHPRQKIHTIGNSRSRNGLSWWEPEYTKLRRRSRKFLVSRLAPILTIKMVPELSLERADGGAGRYAGRSRDAEIRVH